MYVVQIGNYAWLGTFNGEWCITTSLAHATRLDSFPANERAAWLRDNRTAAFANSALHRRLRDFYATAPVSVMPAKDLEDRLSRPAYVAAPKVAQPADRDATVRPAGVTRQIYQWVLDNPQATREDARRAFPDANASTVSVQFGAARRASAA